MKQKLLIFVVAALASFALAEKVSINLGKAAVHSPLRHTFLYRNPDPLNPAQIKRVDSSCSCLRILSYPSEVAAGSSAGITIELTPDKTGSLDYTLMVLTASGEHQMFSLHADIQSSDDKTITSSIALPSRVITPHDETLYITPPEVRVLDPAPFFVDVRSAADYQQCHISGSLNLFQAFVGTKGWLKTKPVVLVDGGWGDGGLEQTARALKASGFPQVWILYGGLSAWRTAGGLTEGTMPGLPSLSEISAADYLRCRDFNDWVVMDLRSAPADALPERTVLDAAEPPEQLAAALTALTAGASKRVLITDDDGQGYAAVRRALAGWTGAPVFYLKDGMQGVRNHLNMMAAASQSRTVTLATRTGTAAAHSGPGGIGVPVKKCGTCPH